MRVEFYGPIRYEWKPMSEAENKSVAAEMSPADPTVAVVVPLFPKLPGLRESLASLGAQTHPPDLVVLLDDGTSPDAEKLHDIIPALHVEVVQVEPGLLAAALDALAEYLANFDFVGLLQAGDAYAPARIERCLETLLNPGEGRPPVMAVSALTPIDSRSRPLPADEPRAVHFERLWAPGRAGAELPDWLGAGHFPGPVSNLFMRREFLGGLQLDAQTPNFGIAAVLLAALQSQLAVIDEPLLSHYPPPVEAEPSPRASADLLQTQMAVLTALRDKLPVSPETRRNLASYHRAAWNSLSGVREDLFQQAVLRLASLAAGGEVQDATAEVLRAREARTAPAHWAALLAGKDPLDVTGYASALRKTREKLREALDENERLGRIATAAQGSGWVRFGAWLGERSARRMMELEQEEAEAEKAVETPPAPQAAAAEKA
jgi:hypothetical protein